MAKQPAKQEQKQEPQAPPQVELRSVGAVALVRVGGLIAPLHVRLRVDPTDARYGEVECWWLGQPDVRAITVAKTMRDLNDVQAWS